MGFHFQHKIFNLARKMKLSLLLMIQIGAIPTSKTLVLTHYESKTFDEMIQKILEEIKSLSTLKTPDLIPKASDPFDQSFDDFAAEPNDSPFDKSPFDESIETDTHPVDSFFDSANEPLFDESIFDVPNRIQIPIYDELKTEDRVRRAGAVT